MFIFLYVYFFRFHSRRSFTFKSCGGGFDQNEVTETSTEPTNSGSWTDSGNYDTSFAGSGTEGDPYQISSPQELAGIAYQVNSGNNLFSGKYFIQTADIDLSTYWWNPIGTIFDSDSDGDNVFFGNYDGGNYTISNLFINSGKFQGLFGYVDNNVADITNFIKNINLDNVNISSSDSVYAGGLIGVIRGHNFDFGVGGVGNWEISNVHVSGNLNISNINGNSGGETVDVMGTGGVVGYVDSASTVTISDCSFNGNILRQKNNITQYNTGGILGTVDKRTNVNIIDCSTSGQIESTDGHYVGGILGGATLNYNGGSGIVNIENCYNEAEIVGQNYIGGILGGGKSSYSDINIENCYNIGSVEGTGYVGGVVGQNYSSTVSNSYNTGSVTGGGYHVGGVVGWNYSSTVSNSYNTGSVTGSANHTGGVVGWNYSSTVSNSYNTCSVEGAIYVGGVVGYNRSSSTVSNSYNTGSVTGSDNVGGVVGWNISSSTVSNSYNTGSVTGSDNVGGVAGSNSGTITFCYWGVNCTLISGYGSNIGTISNCERFENDNDPKTESFYTTSSNWDSSYPWDFENTWGISQYVNDGYPFIKTIGSFWTDEGNYSDEFGGGTGTESDPYLISTPQELARLSYLTNSGDTSIQTSYFRQTADLDMSEHIWVPISSTFWGHYDGGNFTISGLNTQASESNQGLFGYIQQGTIENVGVINSNILGDQNVGGIVGQIFRGSGDVTISNCYFEGEVKGNSYVGGIVGQNYACRIENCYNLGNITGDQNVGGIVGSANRTHVTKSYNKGNVSGDSNVGGIIGNNQSSEVANCFNSGNIYAKESNVGGIVGYTMTAYGESTIQINYNMGIVQGEGDNIGGIVGFANRYQGISTAYSYVRFCFNIGAVENLSGSATNIGGVIGQNGSNNPSHIAIWSNYWGGDCQTSYGIGNLSSNADASFLSTLATDAKTLDWYNNSSNWNASPPWDFDSVWAIDEYVNDGYPYLMSITYTSPMDKSMFWTDSGNYDTNFEGSGTESDPYLISTPRELAGLAYLINNSSTNADYASKYYLQTANLNMMQYWWDAIGTYTSDTEYLAFSGHYDGGEYTISGLFTPAGSDSNYSYQGLFGYVRGASTSDMAEISNVTIENSIIQGYRLLGGIAGEVYQTNINNCINYASVSGTEAVGGIVGSNYTSSYISDSENYGVVFGDENGTQE